MNALTAMLPVLQPVQTMTTGGREIPEIRDSTAGFHLSHTIETHRIRLLIERDGIIAARAWVERTLNIYRKAVSDTRNWAASGDYKPSFEASIRAFEEWLSRQPKPITKPAL